MDGRATTRELSVIAATLMLLGLDAGFSWWSIEHGYALEANALFGAKPSWIVLVAAKLLAGAALVSAYRYLLVAKFTGQPRLGRRLAAMRLPWLSIIMAVYLAISVSNVLTTIWTANGGHF